MWPEQLATLWCGTTIMTLLMCGFQFILYESTGGIDCLFRKCEHIFHVLHAIMHEHDWYWYMICGNRYVILLQTIHFHPFIEVSKLFKHVVLIFSPLKMRITRLLFSVACINKCLLYNALKDGSLHLLQVTSLSKIIYTFVMLRSIYTKIFLSTNYYIIFSNTRMGSIINYNLLNNICGSTKNQTIVRVSELPMIEFGDK